MKTRINMRLKKLLIIAGMLFASIALGFLLLSACYLIPSGAQHDNLAKSAAILSEEKTYQKETYSNRSLDNFTDSLMLLESGYTIYDNAFVNAIRAPLYTIVANDLSPKKTLQAIAGESQEATGTIDYSRYWHGYQVILRPLLLIFDYGQIRQLNSVVFFFLSMLVVMMLLRQAPRCVIPFILSFLLMSPTAIVDSLQYSVVSYITLFTMASVLFSLNRDNDPEKVLYTFLFSGIAVAFFDLLTFPTVAMTLPLALFCSTTGSKQRTTALILKCVVYWGIGYVGMWMGKWLIALAYGGKPYWDAIINSIRYRSGTEWKGENAGRLTVLLYNIKELFRNHKLTICIVCYAVISTGAVFMNRNGITGKRVRTSLTLLVPALIPVCWIVIVANHSWNHTWFTYRTLAPCVFSLLCMLNISDISFGDKASKYKRHGDHPHKRQGRGTAGKVVNRA